MDTEKFQKNDTPEAQQVQEGTSRRKLLMAGAAALPVMVTIKSTSAEAAGLTATPATWWWHHHDEPEPPTQNGLLNSISCIQNIEMPWDYDGATKDVCHKENLDYSGWCDRKWGHGYSSLDNGIMPANFQLANGHSQDRYRDNDDKCDRIYDYFCDGGRINFWPGCKFDVSKERHCTYVQICLSTACWDSISTAVNITKNGLGDI